MNKTEIRNYGLVIDGTDVGGGGLSAFCLADVATIRLLEEQGEGTNVIDISTGYVYAYNTTDTTADDGINYLKLDTVTTGRFIKIGEMYAATSINKTASIKALLDATTLTANVTITLQDTSGTLALLENAKDYTLLPNPTITEDVDGNVVQIIYNYYKDGETLEVRFAYTDGVETLREEIDSLKQTAITFDGTTVTKEDFDTFTFTITI